MRKVLIFKAVKIKNGIGKKANHSNSGCTGTTFY